jgi:hypothetical protein
MSSNARNAVEHAILRGQRRSEREKSGGRDGANGKKRLKIRSLNRTIEMKERPG